MRRGLVRGLSLVELLAGLAIGLLVAGAAVTFVLAHLRDDRRASEQRRLVRELHAAADLVAHDLRRAGHWSDVTAAAWAGAGGAVAANPHAAISPETAASDAARYTYARYPPGHGAEDLGLRLRGGVVELLLAGGQWQALTDIGSVHVTHLALTPSVQPLPLQALCARPCPPGAPACPPVHTSRLLALEMRGRLPGQGAVSSAALRLVRLRNDVVTGACAA